LPDTGKDAAVAFVVVGAVVVVAPEGALSAASVGFRAVVDAGAANEKETPSPDTGKDAAVVFFVFVFVFVFVVIVAFVVVIVVVVPEGGALSAASVGFCAVVDAGAAPLLKVAAVAFVVAVVVVVPEGALDVKSLPVAGNEAFLISTFFGSSFCSTRKTLLDVPVTTQPSVVAS
jgi:hypothetical protein